MIIANLKKTSLLNYGNGSDGANIDESCEDCGTELDNQQMCPNCDSETDETEETTPDNGFDTEDEE